MIYKPLPSEVLLTLAQQSQSFHSTTTSLNSKGGEEFVVDYIQTRNITEIEDLSSQLKKVNILKNYNLLFLTLILSFLSAHTPKEC